MPGRIDTYTLDGSKARWPDKVDGLELRFVNVKHGESLDDHIKVFRSLLDPEQPDLAAYDFFNVNIRNRLLNQLDTHLKSKEGAKLSRDEVAAYFEALTIEPNERRQGVSPAAKAKAAEAKAEAATKQAEATQAALVTMLKGLPKKQAAEQVESLIASGVLPEGFSL